jgi:hypothetical protein
MIEINFNVVSLFMQEEKGMAKEAKHIRPQKLFLPLSRAWRSADSTPRSKRLTRMLLLLRTASRTQEVEWLKKDP